MRWYASLRRAGEIAFVRRTGRSASTEAFAAHAAGSRSAPSRVTVAVSKSVGNAVLRNLVKRRIKGALDALPAPAAPLRLVVTVRPPAAEMPYAVLAGQLAAAVGQLSHGLAVAARAGARPGPSGVVPARNAGSSKAVPEGATRPPWRPAFDGAGERTAYEGGGRTGAQRRSVPERPLPT